MLAARGEAILILGCPRSGTTLLRRLIGAHPNVHCPAETSVFTACGRFLREERIVGEVPIGVLSGLELAGIPASETLRRLRELAFGLHRDLAAAAGKPRWAAKTAFDTFYVDELVSLCGDGAAFVCITRHGLDVVCSLEELCARNGTYLRELHDYVQRHQRPRDAFAHVWIDLTRRLLRLVEELPGQALHVRYEDLVAAPRETMARVFEFIGESADGWSLDAALASKSGLGLGDWKAQQKSALDPSGMGRWRTLPPIEASRLADQMNDVLEQAGYPRIKGVPQPTAEEARRRYQLGLMLPAVQPKGR